MTKSMENLSSIDRKRIDIEVTADDVAKRFLQATDLYTTDMLERVRSTFDTRANKWVNESSSWVAVHDDISGSQPGADLADLIGHDIDSYTFDLFAESLARLIQSECDSAIAYKQRMTLQAATLGFALTRHLAETTAIENLDNAEMADLADEKEAIDIEVENLNVQVRTTFAKGGDTTDTANAKIDDEKKDNVDVYMVLHASPDETQYGVGVNFIHQNNDEDSAPVKARDASGW